MVGIKQFILCADFHDIVLVLFGQISDAFKRFGMNPSDGCMLIVEVTDGKSKIEEIQSKVQGQLVDATHNMADETLIKKV